MREVNTHKIIRIFLASSIDDTKEERDKLQNKILAVWNPIFNKFNIELKIFRCEQMTEEWLKRNQKTIDDEIRNSDVFIVIFKNTVGNYTFHEFEVARDCYSKTNGKPRIYPYISNELIKNIDKIPALQEITRDDNYPETFSVIDTIEISLFPVKDPMKRRDRNTGRFADGNHFWIPVVKRSEHAREQPGFYQFAPCGGFRIFDEPEAAENDRNIQEQNFDFFRAILHLYVRELFNETTGSGDKFGDSKYDKPEHASLSDAAVDSPYAEELCAMLQDGRANMEFLGASVSVAALKYDLVFSLVIHDQEFFLRNRKAFKSDYYAASLNIYPVEYLLQENFLHGENCLAEEIVGPLALLSASEQIDDDLRTKLKEHCHIS